MTGKKKKTAYIRNWRARRKGIQCYGSTAEAWIIDLHQNTNEEEFEDIEEMELDISVTGEGTTFSVNVETPPPNQVAGLSQVEEGSPPNVTNVPLVLPIKPDAMANVNLGGVLEDVTEEVPPTQPESSTSKSVLHAINELWGDGSWTEKQKRGMVNIINTYYNGNLPSIHKISQSTINVKIEELGEGKFSYFGLETGIQSRLAACPQFASTVAKIDLVINVDGIPISRSSKRNIWPILCTFGYFSPITVAVFEGRGKPSSLHTFVKKFLDELIDLQQHGVKFIHGEKNYCIPVSTKAWVCDAPAREWLKNTKGHSGYNACERCTMEGSRPSGHFCHNSIQYSDAQPRTDEDFACLKYTDSSDSRRAHQHGKTPLIDYNIPCVTLFALDYMHVVCLGVVKRWLSVLTGKMHLIGSTRPLEKYLCERLDIQKATMGRILPSDFTRQEQRTIGDIAYWKAKELRNFLLYTGPVLLKILLNSSDNCKSREYEAFITFSACMRILLLDNHLRRTALLPKVKELLQWVVEETTDLYGSSFPTYNVHCLVHLPEDCENIGCSLQDISSFPFENHLGVIKSQLNRNYKNPIVSIARKLCLFDRRQPQMEGRFTGTVGTAACKSNDSCFILDNGDVVLVQSINLDKTLNCKLYKRENMKPLYTYPLDSRDVYTYVLDTETPCCTVESIPRTYLKRKAAFMSLPEQPETFVAVGVLHYMTT